MHFLMDLEERRPKIKDLANQFLGRACFQLADGCLLPRSLYGLPPGMHLERKKR